MVTYIFDGSFHGILTAVYESYERKHKQVKLLTENHFLPDMFGDALRVYTDRQKAERVWKGLGKKTDSASQKQFYSAFLADKPTIFQDLFEYAQYIFDHPQGHAHNYGNAHVLAISQMARQVHREKHRMEAFIRFRKSADGLFFAIVNPDFNVLPLVARHFQHRYADQYWVIYDERRKYGIHYDLHSIQEITFDFKTEAPTTTAVTMVTIDEHEALYATLWQDYFKSTNIVARKNMKLHIQHVPKRYWRYLTEKTADCSAR